jgi:hypothetical protein
MDAPARFRVLLELYELSAALMRRNLRRRRPDATDAEIEAGLRRWLVKEGEPEQVPWTVRKRTPS